VDLNPLLEAESGRVRLEMPADFMRLGRTIEFIEAKSNRILPEKSATYQAAFQAQGFVFPATIVGGNPSTMKPYDEGYFIADAGGAVFHLRQVQGVPELKRIADMVQPEEKARWTALKPRFIQVQEQDNHEVRAIIVAQSGEVSLVIGPDYRLVTLPLTHFDPATMLLSVRGDLLNRLAVVNSDHHVEAVVLNRNYEFVDRYTEKLLERKDGAAGKLAGNIFPFTLNLEDRNSGYLGFHFEPGKPLVLALNVVLVILLVTWFLLRKERFAARWPELLSVAATGVFGFILVWLIPKS
jgi:hypothetical protein